MEIERLDPTPRMSRGVIHAGVLYTSGLVRFKVEIALTAALPY